MEAVKHSSSYKWWVLLLITTYQLTCSGAVFVFGPLAPFLIDGLRITRAQVGLFTTAIYLGYVITAIPWSILADRIGAKRIMIVAPLLQGAGYLAMSRTSSFVPAWFSILFAGLAYAAVTSVTVKALVYWFPPELRATAIGSKQTGAIMGGALAAFTLPAITMATSWQTAIFITGIGLVLIGIVSFSFYRDHPAESHLDKASGRTPVNAVKVNIGSVTRLVLLNRNILLLSLITMVFGAAQFSFSSYLVLYAKEVLLFSVISASTILAFSQVSSGIGRLGWGIISDRYFPSGRRLVLIIIGLVSTLMFLVLSVPAVMQSRLVIYIITIVMGATILSWWGVELVMVAEMVGKELSASASGVSMTIVCLGNLAGPPLFGYIVDLTGSYPLAWRLVALAVFVSTLFLLLVREPKKSPG